MLGLSIMDVNKNGGAITQMQIKWRGYTQFTNPHVNLIQLFQYSLYIKNHLQGDSSQLCIGSIWSLCWKWQYQSTIIHSTVSQARSTGLSLIQALEHHWSADACMGWEG